MSWWCPPGDGTTKPPDSSTSRHHTPQSSTEQRIIADGSDTQRASTTTSGAFEQPDRPVRARRGHPAVRGHPLLRADGPAGPPRRSTPASTPRAPRSATPSSSARRSQCRADGRRAVPVVPIGSKRRCTHALEARDAHGCAAARCRPACGPRPITSPGPVAAKQTSRPSSRSLTPPRCTSTGLRWRRHRRERGRPRLAEPPGGRLRRRRTHSGSLRRQHHVDPDVLTRHQQHRTAARATADQVDARVARRAAGRPPRRDWVLPSTNAGRVTSSTATVRAAGSTRWWSAAAEPTWCSTDQSSPDTGRVRRTVSMVRAALRPRLAVVCRRHGRGRITPTGSAGGRARSVGPDPADQRPGSLPAGIGRGWWEIPGGGHRPGRADPGRGAPRALGGGRHPRRRDRAVRVDPDGPVHLRRAPLRPGRVGPRRTLRRHARPGRAASRRSRRWRSASSGGGASTNCVDAATADDPLPADRVPAGPDRGRAAGATRTTSPRSSTTSRPGTPTDRSVDRRASVTPAPPAFTDRARPRRP